MSKETLSMLKKVANQTTDISSQTLKTAILGHIFSTYTKESEQLSESYLKLSNAFKINTLELAKRNEELNKKVAQLDVITNYLHNILNSISHGILFVDLNGVINTYNGAAETILERDSLDVLYASYWDYFPDDLFGFSMGEALSNQTAPHTLFTTIETPSKEVRELELHTSFVFQSEDIKAQPQNECNDTEIIQGIVVTIRDCTELNRFRRLASRNDRMKELGEIAASVAHEIRNPLGGIKGFASLLHRDLAQSPHLQQMADQIIKGAESLNRLVTDVLNYTRPLQINRQTTDIILLFEELKRYVAAEYSSSPKINIEIQSEQPSYSIPIDRQLMHSVFLNLLVNSIQAMPEGGTIRLAVRDELGQAIISVSDTGIGIIKENLDKIFSPFFTTKTNGNGFGLSEVHKVVLAHEGTIDVSSEENIGTTFTIKLPSKTYTRKKI